MANCSNHNMELLNARAAAKELGLSRQAVIYHIGKHNLIAVLVGSQFIIERDALEEFKLSRRAPGRPRRKRRRHQD